LPSAEGSGRREESGRRNSIKRTTLIEKLKKRNLLDG
jgi:hypothetical protein